MTGAPLLDTILFLVSLVIAVLIGLAEFAIVSSSRSRLDTLADAGDALAARALRLKDRDEDVQGATQIATLFLIIFSSFIITPYVRDWASLGAGVARQAWLFDLLQTAGFAFIAFLLTGLFLVTVHLFAKSLGERYADALVLHATGGMHTLVRLLHLPQRALTVTANLLLRPFRGAASFRESVTTEENLMDILEDGAKTGLLDRTEHELIESIFQFTETTAREIMIPRTDIIGVEIRMTPSEILKLILEEGFTRMPVYEESLDNIVGVIYAKDVLSLIEHHNLIILQDIVRPAYIVPETKPISELLREFQLKRQHMAIVVDEFGGTEGIITMEDILEEIVGEIRDEYDEEESPYVLLPGGGIEVEAMVNIADLNAYSPISIPESDDYDTVGGFVTKLFGRIPESGERIAFQHALIEVIDAEERRVLRVRLLPDPDAVDRNNGR
ncbi:MAG: hemolysin family protein [Bacteroidota bacterium]|jgi:CBS domain containing-hemolysin-like protein|nr:hemolysin family protein [Bacteroidota bacterium]